MHVADALSRSYLTEQPTNADLSDDMDIMVHSLIANLLTTQKKLVQVESVTAQDEDLQVFSKVVTNA